MGHGSGHGKYPDNWIFRDAVMAWPITKIAKAICEWALGPYGPGPIWAGPIWARAWAGAHMGPGPYGPGPGPGPSVLVLKIKQIGVLEKHDLSSMCVCSFWKNTTCLVLLCIFYNIFGDLVA